MRKLLFLALVALVLVACVAAHDDKSKKSASVEKSSTKAAEKATKEAAKAEKK